MKRKPIPIVVNPPDRVVDFAFSVSRPILHTLLEEFMYDPDLPTEYDMGLVTVPDMGSKYLHMGIYMYFNHMEDDELDFLLRLTPVIKTRIEDVNLGESVPEDHINALRISLNQEVDYQSAEEIVKLADLSMDQLCSFLARELGGKE